MAPSGRCHGTSKDDNPAWLNDVAIETHNNIRTLLSESSGGKLTRFKIEGWLELIGTPSVNTLHPSDCSWPCCLSSQSKTRIAYLRLERPSVLGAPASTTEPPTTLGRSRRPHSL